MNPHPKIRKTVKWASAAVTVLLVVVWVGSGWVEVTMRPADRYELVADRGTLNIYRLGISSTGRTYLLPFMFTITQPRVRPTIHWTFHGYASRPGGMWNLVVPLWVPVLPFALGTSVAWRLDILARRRARLNLCPTGGCNYDLTGLAAGAVCPECGSVGVPS